MSGEIRAKHDRQSPKTIQNVPFSENSPRKTIGEMKRKAKIQRLSDWEWTTLVAAWRYFEHRATIASATFPEDIVRRFWASGEYADSALTQIANQFANIDHGSDGERSWIEDKTIMDCDRRAWCKFYAFCKAWCGGMKTIVLDGTAPNGKRMREEPLCFWCETTGRWYPVKDYIADPAGEKYCAEKFIKEIKPNKRKE